MARISKITISGFKSIERLTDLEPADLNIFIGANGAGKSNLISFFRMLSFMVGNNDGTLQEYIGRRGGAQDLLHEGQLITRDIIASITITNDRGDNDFAFRLTYIAGGKLMFSEEKTRFTPVNPTRTVRWHNYDGGHFESKLLANTQNNAANTILSLLRGIKVYQFHDTSDTSQMKRKWHKDTDRYLREDGGNIATFLYKLQREDGVYYQKILNYIRLVLPFFDDFVFIEEYDWLLLRWKEKNSTMEFNAAMASDGMLRLIALITLLAQPPKYLLNALFIDEPELGLHPYAIDVIANLLSEASEHCQVFVATQSARLVDNFDPENIIVVDRVGRTSQYRKFEYEELSAWIEDYTMGELWDKNLIGGRP